MVHSDENTSGIKKWFILMKILVAAVLDESQLAIERIKGQLESKQWGNHDSKQHRSNTMSKKIVKLASYLNLNIYLQSWTKYLRQTLSYMWNSTLQERFNF